eukprot:TRINITY_DN751_c0_g1_i4.p2 TRINITY_DN751_c0_g1~~TRINITY_DN751_c0_g1_i4.p2  ORF type:complete len:129 (-),score=39.21 TRINITY_DN751_c0_g1_i4:10-396(-)
MVLNLMGKGKGNGKGYDGGKGGGNLMMQLMGMLAGKGGGKGWQQGWQQKTYSVDKSGGELGEFVGTIKSFGFNKHYGFITCPQLASYGDVFLHGDMKRGYQQGQTVKFTAVLTKEGKVHAIDLKSGLK